MNSKKLLLSTLALAVATPAIVIPMETQTVEAATKTFSDMKSTHPYHKIIMEMTSKGLIAGYQDGTFKPNQSISRQHASVLVDTALKYKGLKLPTYNEQYFYQPVDLPKNHIYFNQMKALLDAGVLSEDMAGKVYPQKALTRGEMAKILAVAFNLKATKSAPFSDSQGDYKQYIDALYSNGVTSGYEDGTFKPNETLNRAHYSLFLYRAMNINNEALEEEAANIDVNPNMKVADFNKSLVGNDKFVGEASMASTTFWNSSVYYRRALTDGQQALEGTNLKYIQILSGVNIEEEGWVNKHAYGFLSSQIVFESYKESRSTLSFDHTSDTAVNVSKKLLKQVYPELDLDSLIDTKVAEGRVAIKNGDAYFGNTQTVYQDGFKVRLGVTESSQYKYFRLEVTK